MSVPTVSMNENCYFPSTWKDAHLGLLTDRKIEKYQLAGFYGEDMRLAALKREEDKIGQRQASKRRQKRMKRIMEEYV
jgi:hypothetical protein